MSDLAIRPINRKSRIEFYYGPMYSGKSTLIGFLLKKYLQSKKKVVYVRYKKDVRFCSLEDDKIITHHKCVVYGGRAEEPILLCDGDMSTIEEELKKYDVIGIDEIQFFRGASKFIKEFNARHPGKIFILSGLLSDFQKRPWPVSVNILAMAHKAKQMFATCDYCQDTKATNTLRTSDETASEVIGSSDKYLAACDKCFSINNIHGEYEIED